MHMCVCVYVCVERVRQGQRQSVCPGGMLPCDI